MALDIQQFLQSLTQMMGMGGGGQPESFGTQAGNMLGEQSQPSMFNARNGQLALGGLSTLSGIMNSAKANKLANEQFKFTKDVTNTNLNNSIQSYNTSLADRANARAFTQNQDQSVADDYINRNRLSR